MDKYNVSLTSRALRDLDGIYVYIVQTLLAPETALALVDKIEKEILAYDFYKKHGFEEHENNGASAKWLGLPELVTINFVR